MNPSDDGWNDPPPPGTEIPQEFMDDSSKVEANDDQDEASKNNKIVDPFLRNPEYMEYEKRRHSRSRDKSKHRHLSHSRSRHSHKRRHRSRSRSRDRHRRSRSRNRRHHRRHSSSSSRSRRSKSKREKKRKRSRSRTRRSRSRSHRRQHSRTKQEEVRSDSEKEEEEDVANTSGEVEDDDEPGTKENAFKNDGSFLEMFKKMQEEQLKAAEAAKEQAGSSEQSAIPAVPKRRGGRVLKTGLVEKTKVMDEFMQGDGLDAWSVYMKEVKRYKEACCDDDSKTRPLVK